MRLSPLLLALAACGAPGEAAKAAPPPTANVEAVAAPPPQAIVAASSARAPAPAPGACGGLCPGHVGSALVEAIGKRARQARRCYESALATDKTLRGRVALRITIGADGRICEATADVDNKAMEGVATCVAALYRAPDVRLPPPDDGCAIVNAPISFI
ncbi:MAG TPA: AgmX/PglI C-terminal domain-containing protein, partial [Labilithrix sp.]|nr:AgmX/PglI C-terminal domain-containing protein [Labilithrix sp.]